MRKKGKRQFGQQLVERELLKLLCAKEVLA